MAMGTRSFWLHVSSVVFLCLWVLLPTTPVITQSSTVRIPGDPVSIDSGQVAGTLLAGDVRAYLGVPYAAAPVGNLRWREPQPVKAWSRVRAADQYGAPCPQRGAVRAGAPAYSEDCLFLNVWAPASPSSKKLPVIVYIFGGSYTGGSSSAPAISGEMLARKGAVYVNFNYRLSVLGSLGLPELTAESPHKASSNYVHLDQIAVLKWVHRNIERFGGDPGNVTLMGQSSGAIDVSYLQASPLTRGLIHKVAALSGAAFPGGPWGARPIGDVEQAGLRFQERLGVKTLAELRALPWEKLLDASGIEINEPTVADGYVLPAPVPDMFTARKQNRLPALLNYCRDEGFGGFGNVTTLDEFKAAVQRIAGPKADEMLKVYSATTDEEAVRAAVRVGRSGGMAKQMAAWAAAQAGGRSSAYLSAFSYGPSAGHGSDVAYWHGTLNPATASQASKAVSDRMSAALIAFAKTGNPGTQDVKWPAFDSSNPFRMDFGERIDAVPVDKGIFFLIANPDVRVGMGGGRGRGRG